MNATLDAVKGMHVRIDPDVHRRLKVHAAHTGRTMAELVEVAIRQLLDRLEGGTHG